MPFDPFKSLFPKPQPRVRIKTDSDLKEALLGMSREMPILERYEQALKLQHGRKYRPTRKKKDPLYIKNIYWIIGPDIPVGDDQREEFLRGFPSSIPLTERYEINRQLREGENFEPREAWSERVENDWKKMGAEGQKEAVSTFFGLMEKIAKKGHQ